MNPRTKSWKVLVPFKFKHLMEQDDMYPAGWVHSKFYGARNAHLNSAKQPRLDDVLVEEFNQEQEKKRLDSQKAEEKRIQEEEKKGLDGQKAEEKRLKEEEKLAEQQLLNDLQGSDSMSEGEEDIC